MREALRASLGPLARRERTNWCGCGDSVGHNADTCVTCTDALRREVERLTAEVEELRRIAYPGGRRRW